MKHELSSVMKSQPVRYSSLLTPEQLEIETLAPFPCSTTQP